MAHNNSLQKLWIQQNVNQNAVERALEVIQMTGKALPCYVKSISSNGSLVTVAFDVNSAQWTLPASIEIPKFESNYFRNPTRIGDKGVASPVGTYIDKISGQSDITPSLSQPPNLSALVFYPVSNVEWDALPDNNAALMQAPNGAIIQTQNGSSKIIVNSSGITLSYGGFSVIIDSSGVTINGKDFNTHTHNGVTTGGDITGPVS